MALQDRHFGTSLRVRPWSRVVDGDETEGKERERDPGKGASDRVGVRGRRKKGGEEKAEGGCELRQGWKTERKGRKRGGNSEDGERRG